MSNVSYISTQAANLKALRDNRKKQKRAEKILVKNIKNCLKRNPDMSNNAIANKVVKSGDPFEINHAQQVACQMRQVRLMEAENQN